VAQTIGVVGIFVSRHDLIDALPQQRQRIMAPAVLLPRIAELRRQLQGQMMALVEGPQGQQTGIAGDLTTGKIDADGLMTVEGEAQLWQNTLYQATDAPKGNAGCANPVFITLLEHPYFFG